VSSSHDLGDRGTKGVPGDATHSSDRRNEVAVGRRTRRRLVFTATGFVVFAAFSVGFALWKIRSSLPLLDGSLPLSGLAARVIVERDGLGVPTVRAASRLDVSRALGFLHAQDRFFQMDLLRRRSAGELAALVGGAAVSLDRDTRVHRFRSRAEIAVGQLSELDRELLTAYTEGVNAGLEALGTVPPEYLALRVSPQAWREADSLLAGYAMFLDLQNETGAHESARGLIHDLLPPDLTAFLLPAGSPLDAPLEGPALEAAAVPSAEVVDLRDRLPTRSLFAQRRSVAVNTWERLRDVHASPEVMLGSNNWAVAGSYTADGRALLAGDMHLRLGLPSIWYRASLVWPSGDGERRVVGVTLPGAPLLLAGSTGRIAWTFTNSEGDWMDLVVLETDPDDPNRYRSPDGWVEFTRHSETIEIAGSEPETLEVLETIWGPVIDRDHAGQLRAIRWTAHDPGAVNLSLMRLEDVATVDEAIRLADQMGVPAQNFVCVDDAGRVGWTIIGRIPRRVGFNGRVPVSWADGSARWEGWLSSADRPTVIDPQSGRLWTANARVAAR
jgi:penicillin amidase